MEQRILLLYDRRRYSYCLVSNLFVAPFLKSWGASEDFEQRSEFPIARNEEYEIAGIEVPSWHDATSTAVRDFAERQSIGLEQLAEHTYFLKDLGEGKYSAMA